MGAAIEIATVFFFKNFVYTFGGKLYVQMSGGSIGTRLTMCAAIRYSYYEKPMRNQILTEKRSSTSE